MWFALKRRSIPLLLLWTPQFSFGGLPPFLVQEQGRHPWLQGAQDLLQASQSSVSTASGLVQRWAQGPSTQASPDGPGRPRGRRATQGPPPRDHLSQNEANEGREARQARQVLTPLPHLDPTCPELETRPSPATLSQQAHALQAWEPV